MHNRTHVMVEGWVLRGGGGGNTYTSLYVCAFVIKFLYMYALVP